MPRGNMPRQPMSQRTTRRCPQKQGCAIEGAPSKKFSCASTAVNVAQRRRSRRRLLF